MRPKTKLQLQVVEADSKLPFKLTPEHIEYGKNNLFESWGVVSRKKIVCLECNHSWKDESPQWHNQVVRPKCPECQASLKMFQYNQPVFEELEYMAILEIVDNFQVVRIIAAKKIMTKTEKPMYHYFQVMKHFINEKGENISFSLKTFSMSGYYDAWCWGSELTLQSKAFNGSQKHRINPWKIYPKMKILPIIKRNGFKKSFYNLAPQVLFSSILSSDKAELLLKTKQLDVLKHYISDSIYRIETYWPSILIAIRNNYIIKDYTIWQDYIGSLIYFGKDIRNAKYVCPENLMAAHDHYLDKRNKLENRKSYELEKAKIEKEEKLYAKKKERFFGLKFTDGKLKIKVLESVKEFYEEANELSHCIYRNGYYKKDTSLLFSASINNKRIETIEFDLKNFGIIQSRGLGNQASNYQTQIINLVMQNTNKIQSRLSKKKKAS